MCGNGIKTRMLDCVRSDGKSVNLKYCEEVRGGCVISLWVNSSRMVSVHAVVSDRCFMQLFASRCFLLNTLLKRDSPALLISTHNFLYFVLLGAQRYAN